MHSQNDTHCIYIHTLSQIQTAWNSLSLGYCQQLYTDYPDRKIVFIAMGKHAQVYPTPYPIQFTHYAQHAQSITNTELSTCAHTHTPALARIYHPRGLFRSPSTPVAPRIYD